MNLHQSQTPAPLLTNHLPRLSKGKALDIATGYGRNAFYLAEQGYDVEGIDIDEEAVRFCNAEAKKRKLSFVANRSDLEKGPFVKDAGYSLISCFYYLDRKIIPDIRSALRVGGVIVYETFLIDQHERYGKPSRKAFCWGHNELLQSFSAFRIHYYHEGMILPSADPTREKGQEGSNREGRWVAQLVAEKTS